VRIEYFADEPVSLWARPYFDGKQVLRVKSNASFPRSGGGYALGWFSLDDASAVDEFESRPVAASPIANGTSQAVA
jgi:hypothetical protein